MRPIDAEVIILNLEKIKDRAKSSGNERIFSLNDIIKLITFSPTVYDELQTPKRIKPKLCSYCEKVDCTNCEHDFNRCPNCNEVLDNDAGIEYKHCPECGQALLWKWSVNNMECENVSNSNSENVINMTRSELVEYINNHSGDFIVKIVNKKGDA